MIERWLIENKDTRVLLVIGMLLLAAAHLKRSKGQNTKRAKEKINGHIEKQGKLKKNLQKPTVNHNKRRVDLLIKVIESSKNGAYDWNMHTNIMEALIEKEKDRDLLECPINQTPFIEPVIVESKSGHRQTYEKKDIEAWMGIKKQNPFISEETIDEKNIKVNTEKLDRLNEIIKIENQKHQKDSQKRIIGFGMFWEIFRNKDLEEPENMKKNP